MAEYERVLEYEWPLPKPKHQGSHPEIDPQLCSLNNNIITDVAYASPHLPGISTCWFNHLEGQAIVSLKMPQVIGPSCANASG